MVEFWRAGGPGALNPVESARGVEADGWDGQMFMDSQCLSADPWVLMGAWAAATERLKLCTGVSNPLTRHNAVTAACASTLQAISDGRAVLGIGRGDSALAYLGLAPVGLASFEQSLGEIQSLLSGGAVEFGGVAPGVDAPSLDTMSLGDRPTASRLEWLPSGMAKVPLDVAATGPRVIEMSAPIAERVTFSVGAIPDRINWALGLARQARAARGLTDEGIAYGAQIIVACHPDSEVVRPFAGSFVAPLARFQVIQGDAKGPMTNSDAVNFAAIRKGYDMTKHGKGGAHGKLVGNEITPDFIDRFAIVGPPDHCIERLLQLIGFGIERFVVVGPGLHPEAGEGGRTLFATEVMPAVRAAMEEKARAKVPA
jgi:5,10-methylenetetrahydromethanopterin reductase